MSGTRPGSKCRRSRGCAPPCTGRPAIAAVRHRLLVDPPGPAGAVHLAEDVRGVGVAERRADAAGDRHVVRVAGMGDATVVRRQPALRRDPVEIRRRRPADDVAIALVLVHDHHDVAVGRRRPAVVPPAEHLRRGRRRGRPRARRHADGGDRHRHRNSESPTSERRTSHPNTSRSAAPRLATRPDPNLAAGAAPANDPFGPLTISGLEAGGSGRGQPPTRHAPDAATPAIGARGQRQLAPRSRGPPAPPFAATPGPAPPRPRPRPPTRAPGGRCGRTAPRSRRARTRR
jgi:hypothetical protein